MDPLRGKFTHLSGVDGFTAAVGAIAACEDLWIRGLHKFINDHTALLVCCDARNLLEERSRFLLTNGLDHHVARNFEKLERAIGLFASKRKPRPVFTCENSNRRGLPNKFNTVFACKLHFVMAC